MDSSPFLSDLLKDMSINLDPVSKGPSKDKVKTNKSKRKVGLVDDKRCELHVQTPDHQESPDRVKAIRHKLKSTGLYDKLRLIEPFEPTKEDLLLVHTNKYINKVMRICNKYPKAMIDTEDVRVTGEGSLVAAGIAAGGVLAAIDAVITSKRVRKVFCNVRPPGHHASAHQASGFCIFNNIAIGAKKALTYEGINKVLIVDWDLHHGNGTQRIFKCSKDIMFTSLHRGAPFYPNSGSIFTKGKHYNIHNYPQHLSPESPVPADIEGYMKDFQDILARGRDFNPDLILISCGFDGHKDDFYHSLPLDYNHYKIMTKELCKLANECSNGRLVSVLEGGYTLDVIANCAAVHVNELIVNN
jgi:acetoin utilization deacetylase AcuC-like enzyme